MSERTTDAVGDALAIEDVFWVDAGPKSEVERRGQGTESDKDNDRSVLAQELHYLRVGGEDWEV